MSFEFGIKDIYPALLIFFISIIVGCSSYYQPQGVKISLEDMGSWLEDAEIATVNVDVANVYQGSGANQYVADVIRKGEKVYVIYDGEPLNGPLHVYTTRQYFGEVDGSSLSFIYNEEQLKIRHLERFQYRKEVKLAKERERLCSGKPEFEIVESERECPYVLVRSGDMYAALFYGSCPDKRVGSIGCGDILSKGWQSFISGHNSECRVEVVDHSWVRLEVQKAVKESCVWFKGYMERNKTN